MKLMHLTLDHFIVDQHVPYFEYAKFEDLTLESVNKWIRKLPLKILDYLIKILENKFGGELTSMGALMRAAQRHLSENSNSFSYSVLDIEIVFQTLQEHYPLYCTDKDTNVSDQTNFSGLSNTSSTTTMSAMTMNHHPQHELDKLDNSLKIDFKSRERIKLLTALAIQKLFQTCKCRTKACFHNGQFNMALEMLRIVGIDSKRLVSKRASN